MKTKNNLKKINGKKTRKNKNMIGGTLTTEQVEYYSSFMSVKADATAVLHKFDNVRRISYEMCQELTRKICMSPNNIFNYIKDVVTLSMFSSDDDLGRLDINKVDAFLKDEFVNDPEKYELSFEAFKKIYGTDEITPEDINNYTTIFYRFYLKGGSACVYMIELFNSYILSNPNLSRSQRTLSSDEIIDLMGKYSDYDFNFLINRNIPKEHYDQLTLIASKTICEFLREIIAQFRGELFNNNEFIKNFREKLSENDPPLNTSSRVLTQVLKVKGNFNKYALEFGYKNENRLLNSIRNDSNTNKLGNININHITIDNKAYEGTGIKNAIFILIRLMTYLTNSHKFPTGYVSPEGKTYPVEHEFPPICGELIDISIPTYNSYEKNVKWLDESTTIKLINGVYCYNLNVIIKDLSRMIFEDETLGNLKKLDKRKKRLLFFDNLICILPRILFDESQLYKETGLKTTYDNCKKMINNIFTCDDFNKRPKLLKYLTTIVEGIYLNFPDVINLSNLNIYVLLKQYFYHYLIISLQSQPLNDKYYFIENVLLQQLKLNTSVECNYIYDSNNDKYFNFLYYDVRTANHKCVNINSLLKDSVYDYLDILKTQGLSEEKICEYFILFNGILYSFMNNPMMMYNGLIYFIEYLKKISTISSNVDNNSSPYQPIINLRESMMVLIDKHDFFLSSTIKGNEIRRVIIRETLNIINDPIYENAIKLYLYDDYSYQLNYALLYFYAKNIVSGDMPTMIGNFLSSNYSIFDGFNCKIIFPVSMGMNISINDIYDKYKEICYKLLDGTNFNLDHYPCKLNINLIKNNDKSYDIVCKIDIFYLVNNRDDDTIPDIINNYMRYILEKNGSSSGYRILSYELFTVNVEIGIDYSDKTYYIGLNDVIDDASYLDNSDYKKYFFENYQLYQEQDIFSNLLIEPINNVTDNYNEKIDDVETDMLIKYKYSQKLLKIGDAIER